MLDLDQVALRLRLTSVSPATQRYYAREVNAFISFCDEQSIVLPVDVLKPSDRDAVDLAMAKYFAHLFVLNYTAARMRFCLHGYILGNTHFDGNSLKPFPRSNKVIKSVGKARPGSSMDPWPEFAVFALAYKVLEIYGWLPCMALLVQYDSYLRSKNLLQIDKEHFSPPQPAAGRAFASSFGLKVGTRGAPTKNSTFNHVVLLGDIKP